MKYRIKEIVDGNGDSHYLPQVKLWYGWKTLIDNVYSIVPIKVSTRNLAVAKSHIDRHYKRVNSYKVKKINYIDYIPYEQDNTGTRD